MGNTRQRGRGEGSISTDPQPPGQRHGLMRTNQTSTHPPNAEHSAAGHTCRRCRGPRRRPKRSPGPGPPCPFHPRWDAGPQSHLWAAVGEVGVAWISVKALHRSMLGKQKRLFKTLWLQTNQRHATPFPTLHNVLFRSVALCLRNPAMLGRHRGGSRAFSNVIEFV